MLRSQQHLENVSYIQIDLDTPITIPGNNQFKKKTGYKFTSRDRNNFYDWYNAYFRVNYKFEAKANGANIVADTQSAPINGSFSLIKNLKISSAGKKMYEANGIHKHKVFSSKICLIFQTIIQEAWQKTNFAILMKMPPQ